MNNLHKLHTKIVCTLGPATSSERVIERLIKAGMNVARLNLSHGTYAEHARFTQVVRELGDRLGIPVGILMDLPGPKYRVAALKGGSMTLKPGATVILTTRQIEGSKRGSMALSLSQTTRRPAGQSQALNVWLRREGRSTSPTLRLLKPMLF